MRSLFLLFAWLSFSVVTYTQTLVAYYPFNGNPNDQSGNAINPTYIGSGVTLTTDRFGNANRAYYFDGTPGPNYSTTGSYIRMPSNSLPSTDRTISIWFYTTNISNMPGLLGYGGNGSCGTTLLMGLNCTGTGQYWVQGHCGANQATYTYPSAPVNNWYHWVLTINGSIQKIFINGELKSTSNTFSGSTATAGVDFALGSITHTNGLSPYTDANVGFFQGKLDDVRIYDAAMSDAQVLQLYKNESTGLVAYYPFNGNANDESGNGNNGTVTGSTVTLTSDRFGNANKAYSFTNLGRIEVPTNPSFYADEFTISYWYKVSDYSINRGVMSCWGFSGNGAYQQLFRGSTFDYLIGYNFPLTSTFTSSYSVSLPVNIWQHAAVTYQKTGALSSVTKLYINGELKKTDNQIVPIAFPYGPTLFIGMDHMLANFEGELDEIRIYNRVLRPNEIQQEADAMMPDLLVYLPMNGNTNDMSGNGYNGITYGVLPAPDKYGNANCAYSFSGDVGIALPNSGTTLSFSSSPFALSAWVKYSAITSTSVIVGKHFCGTPNGYILAVENNIPKFFISNSSSWDIVSAGTTYADNKWHHVVGVFTGSQQLIYVDGILKGSRGATYANPNTGSLVLVGNTSGSCGSGWFDGCIDEVKIYGAALTASQVTALYKQSRGSGKAISLKANDYVDIGNIGAANNITMEAWVKRNSSSALHYFISGYDYNSYGFGVTGGPPGDPNNNKLFLITQNNQTALSTSIDNLNDGNWHHVAVTNANGSVTFYFDGRINGTPLLSLSGLISNNYVIGSKLNHQGTSLDGSIDEVRIWNGALLQSEIRDWMTRKITPEHSSYNRLIRYYNFDETNISKAIEIKGANTGVLVNNITTVISGAAIGDASVNNLDNPSLPATFSMSTGENFSSLQGAGTANGLFVYAVKDPPELQTGILGLGSNDHYFGVKKAELPSGISASYTATYDYTGNPFVSPATEPTLQLFKRNDNSAANWTNSGAALNTTANTLTVTGQNTEYILGSSGYGLPVTLLSFQAQKINATTAKLTWQTATELNNKGFEVQRSFDGNYFVNVGFVNGAGNSDVLKEYSTTDMPGKTGRVYYRLKQVDFDEHSKLSQIVSVVFDKQGIIKVYPNPAQKQITIEGVDKYSRVQLLDAAGKMVKEQLNNSQYLLNMSLDGLKSGMYLLRLINGKDNTTIKLMIGN